MINESQNIPGRRKSLESAYNGSCVVIDAMARGLRRFHNSSQPDALPLIIRREHIEDLINAAHEGAILSMQALREVSADEGGPIFAGGLAIELIDVEGEERIQVGYDLGEDRPELNAIPGFRENTPPLTYTKNEWEAFDIGLQEGDFDEYAQKGTFEATDPVSPNTVNALGALFVDDKFWSEVSGLADAA
jgi:hypothetical protein